MRGQPGHNTRTDARSPLNFLSMYASTRPRPHNRTLFLLASYNVRGSLMCLAPVFDMLSMHYFYNQTLADVRSTGAGIKCLYCICQQQMSCSISRLRSQNVKLQQSIITPQKCVCDFKNPNPQWLFGTSLNLLGTLWFIGPDKLKFKRN